MRTAFLGRPLFWVGFYLVGSIGAVIVYQAPALKGWLLQMPRVVRRLILLPFLAPPVALPLVPQRRLPCRATAGQITGMPLLALGAAVGVLAQKEIGALPALREATGLVSTGVYRIVRHPIYLGNILFTMGWALIFRATYALLFTPVVAASYVVIILMEEKELEDEYGEEYERYRRKVPWRLIPWAF